MAGGLPELGRASLVDDELDQLPAVRRDEVPGHDGFPPISRGCAAQAMRRVSGVTSSGGDSVGAGRAIPGLRSAALP